MNLHTHRLREPRFRRGAIPFRSSYRLDNLAETIRFERMVPRRHSALAVRCLRPLGHVSLKSLVGMERFELSRAKALVSKTSVSPISTTSPLLSNSQQLSYTSGVQVPNAEPVYTDGGLPGTRTLKMTQLLRLPLPVPPEAHKLKAPRSLEGLGGLSELYLNQPHPSMPSQSLSDSDRYDLNKFFTKTRIPQF